MGSAAGSQSSSGGSGNIALGPPPRKTQRTTVTTTTADDPDQHAAGGAVAAAAAAAAAAGSGDLSPVDEVHASPLTTWLQQQQLPPSNSWVQQQQQQQQDLQLSYSSWMPHSNYGPAAVATLTHYAAPYGCELVDLNVGGTLFTTTRATLEENQPQSRLAALVSGRHGPIRRDSQVRKAGRTIFVRIKCIIYLFSAALIG